MFIEGLNTSSAMSTVDDSSHIPNQEDMTPNNGTESEEVKTTEVPHHPTKSSSESSVKMEIVWFNVLRLGLLHALFPYGFYLFFFKVMWKTCAFTILVAICSGLGVTAGAHRLWCHRSYKARLSLRIVLAFFNLMACQNNIFVWCRDHRVHHKYAETNADPHNSKRGFFFAHVGWLMVKKHPDVMSKGKNVPLQDLLDDPVVYWQKEYFFPATILVAFMLPAVIPHCLWGESLLDAFLVCSMWRYCLILNLSWFVNSAAHLWGNTPYNRHISARENKYVSMGALGEGFHNYHHTFPMDYSTSELGWHLNMSTIFIDVMAWLGLAYDLKVAPKSTVQNALDKKENCQHSEAAEDYYALKAKGE